jgi:hypothetical protein
MREGERERERKEEGGGGKEGRKKGGNELGSHTFLGSLYHCIL